MPSLLNIVLIILAVVLQISLLPKMAILQGFPNLVLVTVICLLLVNRSDDSLWWALLGGICLDLFSPSYFGIYTFSLLAVYLTVYFLTRKIFSDPEIYIALIFFFLASAVFDIPWFIMDKQWQIVLSDAIYNTVVGCIIYFFLHYYLKPPENIKI